MKYFLLTSFFLLTACNGMHDNFFDASSKYDRVQKKDFFGRSAGEVIDALGKPRTVLTEPPNQVWTYRKDNCITFVYFDESGKVGFAEERGTCVNAVAFDHVEENKNETKNNA